jgi:hypothetical protein
VYNALQSLAFMPLHGAAMITRPVLDDIPAMAATDPAGGLSDNPIEKGKCDVAEHGT